MKPSGSRGGAVRRTFRWCRRSTYGVMLALLGLLVWVNQIGLPGFIKTPLVARLRDRGLTLEFERLRLRLTRGIVAENVDLSRPRAKPGEVFHVDEVQIRMRWVSLLSFEFPEILALKLRGGRATLPLALAPDAPVVPLVVDRVQAQIRFTGPDLWELQEFSGVGLGGSFTARGILTNVSALRTPRPVPSQAPSPIAWERIMARAADWVRRTRFPESPAVTIDFHADVAQPALSLGEFRLRAPGASNELGELDGLDLKLRVASSESAGGPRAELALLSRAARTQWGGFDALQLGFAGDWDGSNAVPVRLDWNLETRAATSRWATVQALRTQGTVVPQVFPAGAAAPFSLPPESGPWARLAGATSGMESRFSIVCDGLVAHVETNDLRLGSFHGDFIALHGTNTWRDVHASIALEGLDTPWAGLRELQVELGLRPNAQPPATDAGWEYLRRLAHVDAWGFVSSGPARVPRLDLDGAEFGLVWSAPRLDVTPFQAWFGGGDIVGEATLDVPSRHATATARSSADPHAVEQMLGPIGREQLANYALAPDSLPRFAGEVGITLPRWSGFDHPTREQTLANLTLDAQLNVTNIAFRGIPAVSASGRITYTNRFWRIGPLEVRRPEGALVFDYENDERTRDYHFHFRSGVDPLMVRPLFDEQVRREMDRIALRVPPQISGDVYGRWRSPELIGAQVHVTITNATVRGQPIEWADGDLTYTNRVLVFRDVRAKSGGDAFVPSGALDFNTQLLAFTNARANIPVHHVTRIIGPKTTATMEAFRFIRPPRARVDGIVSVRGPVGTDIRFDLEADEFEWWRLRARDLTARIHLVDETVEIAELKSTFYGGRLAGDLFFDWAGPEKDAAYHLELGVTNVALKEFLADAWPGTNRLEGRISGQGKVTSARTGATGTIQGSGAVTMVDGFLWGLPIFGMFSPLLDAVAPGLGQTRFTSGSAQFTMGDGRLTTRDLEMRSIAMRLRYAGSVGWEGALDATMEAELFRDAPLIGRLLSFAFSPVTKILEYRVLGTLANPQPEPRYIPKLLLGLMRPMSWLRAMLPKEEGTKPVEPKR